MHTFVFQRVEAKYVLTTQQKNDLIRVMQPYMVPDTFGPSTVRNVYFDTPTALLARRTFEHPAYREKIRIRSYGNPSPEDPIFFELKKKYKGVVYKRRCRVSPARVEELLGDHPCPESQIEAELVYATHRHEQLLPVAFLAYEREAYFDMNDPSFRMTFDTKVRVRWDEVELNGSTRGELLLEPERWILEVKTCGGMPLWLSHYLASQQIYKTHWSKYGAAWKTRFERTHHEHTLQLAV